MWLFARVDQQMRLQVPFSDEALAAALESADERPVVGVRAHVCLQVTGLVEILHTVWERTEQHFVGRRLAS